MVRLWCRLEVREKFHLWSQLVLRCAVILRWKFFLFFDQQRMRDFVSSAWNSLRPGGFLLCHSTLTNENTRAWLEAIRARSGLQVTGIPPDEYVELSLLEPHKSFQNSVSILQKRNSSSTGAYEEPIYSTFA
jgi:hypothetical protein